MIAALGFLAALLSISVVWPQVWRSCRHRRTRGLSPTSAWLALGLNVCWFTFGFLIADRAQMVTNAVVGVGNTAVLVSLLITQPRLRTGAELRRTATGALGLATLAAGSVAAVRLLGIAPATVGTALGTVISVVAMAAALPQPLSLLRDRGQDLSGLSPARWRLGTGACASWASYGWLSGEPVVWMSAGFGLCCAVVVCSVLRAAQRTGTPVGTLADVRPALVAVAGRWNDGFACPAQARAVLAA